MPNGVDVVALEIAAGGARAQRRTQGPIIGMIARLDAIKDHDTLLNAFVQVHDVRPDAQLWLIGDGDRRAHLESLVASLDLRDAVSFFGVRQDIGELLGQVDLFAFSTTTAEGFGIALAEAMAVGLPIVATDVPACREVLDEGTCGSLVPAANKGAMAERIVWLLDHPEEALRLGQAAAVRAKQEYDIVGCARAYYTYLLDPSYSKRALKSNAHRQTDDLSSQRGNHVA